VNTEDRGYVYDAAWNLSRLTNNGVVVLTPTVDSDNQFITEYCRDAYDSNGNLTSRGECQAAANYSYDDENRLVSLVSGTAYRSDFNYDGRSRLRIRTDYTWNGTSWIVSAITRYVYDGNRVIQERNSGNTPAVAYTRGNDLSGTLEGAGGIGGLLARSHGYSRGNWTNHNYYFADGNGNITFMINSSQAMVAAYRYDPFGNTISSSGSLSAANVYRFSSKEIHVNSGMYYYLYRFYDPNLQRWINRDPIQEHGGVNTYSFCMNSTLNLVDPLGLKQGWYQQTLILPDGTPFLYFPPDTSQGFGDVGNLPACPIVPPGFVCSGYTKGGPIIGRLPPGSYTLFGWGLPPMPPPVPQPIIPPIVLCLTCNINLPPSLPPPSPGPPAPPVIGPRLLPLR